MIAVASDIYQITSPFCSH